MKLSAGNTGPSLKQIRDAHKEWFESPKTMEGPAGNLAAHHRAQLLAWLDEAREIITAQRNDICRDYCQDENGVAPHDIHVEECREMSAWLAKLD